MTITRFMRASLASAMIVALAACAGDTNEVDRRGAADRAAAPATAAAPTGAASLVRALVADTASRTLVVYKTPTCGCCAKWVDHMKESGFTVEVHDTSDVAPIKEAAGISPQLTSCHTAFIGGYVIEGHVPAADVQRLLRERPTISGLAVPGMPSGSPGMEGPVEERYDVLAIDRVGRPSVYASH